jgi:hypothetical protein
MKSNIERAQDFAIDQWLSDHPEEMTYDQIIEILRKDKWSDSEPDTDWNEIITPWYLIEGHVGEQIADFIEASCSDVLRLLEIKP